jgi:hypothetical protein
MYFDSPWQACCGWVNQDDDPLYLAINNIDKTQIKAVSPYKNGRCEHFNTTISNEFYPIIFGKNSGEMDD